MVAAAAMCLVAALAAPTAGAAAGSKSNKASAAATAAKAHKQARKAKARAAITKKRLALKIRNNRRYIRGSRKLLRRTAARLRAAITGGDKTIDDKINGIVAVVTPVLTQLGEGSLALKAGLETLAAATTAGFDEVSAGFDEVEAGFGEVEAALTDIGDFIGASEYGFAQMLVGATAQGGSFVVTPNIPDDVQQAQTSQHFVAQHSGDLAVMYGVRSNENDGTGADNPAAHCRVFVVNEDASESGGTAPNMDLGGVSFQPVNDKSAVTSEEANNSGFPFGLKTEDNGNDEEDKTTLLGTTVTVAAGDVYEVTMSCVDISADAEDPNA